MPLMDSYKHVRNIWAKSILTDLRTYSQSLRNLIVKFDLGHHYTSMKIVVVNWHAKNQEERGGCELLKYNHKITIITCSWRKFLSNKQTETAKDKKSIKTLNHKWNFHLRLIQLQEQKISFKHFELIPAFDPKPMNNFHSHRAVQWKTASDCMKLFPAHQVEEDEVVHTLSPVHLLGDQIRASRTQVHLLHSTVSGTTT